MWYYVSNYIAENDSQLLPHPVLAQCLCFSNDFLTYVHDFSLKASSTSVVVCEIFGWLQIIIVKNVYSRSISHVSSWDSLIDPLHFKSSCLSISIYQLKATCSIALFLFYIGDKVQIVRKRSDLYSRILTEDPPCLTFKYQTECEHKNRPGRGWKNPRHVGEATS